MDASDYTAFAIASVSLLALAAILYMERKKHEQTQNVFAPSLREELDRGVVLLDFQLNLLSAPRLLKIHGLLYIAVLLIVWEVGRLNGEPAPWNMMFINVLCMAATTLLSLIAKKQSEEKMLPRRRALESMRAALDESAA